MHGLVVLDEDLRPLRPAILWNDGRTAEECEHIEREIGLERLIELTGNRALTGFTAPKLLWLRRHEPDIFARVRHVLLPKDYVRLQLTGELATDVTDASGTLPVRRARPPDFSTEVLAALDLPREWFPDVLESPALAGHTAAGVPVARRRRPGGGGDRRGGRPARAGVGCDRHLRRRVRRARRVPTRPPGPRAHVLSRPPGNLARDGRDAVGSRFAAVAPRHDRPQRRFRLVGRRGRALGARHRRAHVPAVSQRRADSPRRPGRPGSVCRPRVGARPWPRSCARRWRASRSACATRSSCSPPRRSGRRSAGVGGRSAQRAVAADHGLGDGPAARANGGRGGLGVRRRTSRWRRGRACSSVEEAVATCVRTID